ncbi:MAG TPA: 3-oxosteroid 1-dehydrogenase [Pilimelia sp.]|nr:3-oxosteroid 1-dehydrogenase [Pilimelia sp.]
MPSHPNGAAGGPEAQPEHQRGGFGRRQVLRGAAAAGAGVVLSTGLLDRIEASAAALTVAEYDVVVVGSGAAGMTAALAAAHRGLRCVVVEKAPTFGGSAARSGAGIWAPCNEVILAAGVPDTQALAATYLAQVVGGTVPADRQAAFLANAPAMISFVVRNSPLRFRWMAGYPDYYPELPGGMPDGRSIEPDVLDGNVLGAELAHLNPPYLPAPGGVAVLGAEYRWLVLAAVNARGAAVAAGVAARHAAAVLAGKKPLSMGQALAAGLRAGLLDADVPVWLDTPLLDLQFDTSGRVTGVLVSRSGAHVLVKATRGVVLGTGGFEHNADMRAEFQRQPIGTGWTVGAKENTGDGIAAGRRAGAALDLMEDAWWGPTIPLPDQPYFCLAERTLPGGIIVDGTGRRFVNEAAPYHDVVNTMYDRNEVRPTIPAWLIVDQNYRNRYLFRDIPPLLPLPSSWYHSGAVFTALTIGALATKIGVPSQALRDTVTRFNGFARTGQDLDFQRGDSVYDRYYTDPAVRPNPCLAPLWLAPFYAFRIVPGDLGTKGGLRTDARARVLRPDGSVIPGLYAAGNASGAVMGHSYAGAGSTLGPAMTFGYVAAQDIAGTPPPP